MRHNSYQEVAVNNRRVVTHKMVEAHVIAGHEVLFSVENMSVIRVRCSEQYCPWGPNSALEVVIKL